MAYFVVDSIVLEVFVAFVEGIVEFGHTLAAGSFEVESIAAFEVGVALALNLALEKWRIQSKRVGIESFGREALSIVRRGLGKCMWMDWRCLPFPDCSSGPSCHY